VKREECEVEVVEVKESIAGDQSENDSGRRVMAFRVFREAAMA
jgi:hypothetical protein